MKLQPAKLSHEDRAAQLVQQAIEAQCVVTAWSALDSQENTVGPYRLAFGTARFAVVAWGKSLNQIKPQRDYSHAIDAAYTFVSRVGSTRANTAARAALKKAGITVKP